MGCNADPTRKANEDWTKRIADAPTEVRSEQAYVFVTPRIWAGKREWLRAKTAEGAWREVRAFDASDLEAWLEVSPSTSIWFAERIDAPAALGMSGSRWLQAWRSATTPELTNSLLLLGRDSQVAALLKALRDPSLRALSLVGDDRGEAIAFLVSALEVAEASDVLDRLIVTKTPQRIPSGGTGTRPIVVADLESDEGDPPNLSEVSVVRAYPRGRLTERADIELPHLPVSEFQTALQGLGLAESEAERRVAESGASLTVVRRRLADDPAVREPVWARRDEAAAALPMVLAGSWLESAPADLEALALLADRTWEDLEADLTRITVLPDAPVLRFGRTWVTVSQVDALFTLGPRLNRKQIDDFFGVLEQVFCERDPALDLPPEEWWMANVLGKQQPFSETLVQGLGDTLCIFAIFGQAICGDRLDIDLSIMADRFVRRMLSGLSREQWLSRRHLLRTLGEAAPTAFLDCMEAELAQDDPAIGAIMGSVSGGVSGDCLRTDLLWALETLARDPAHVRRVAEILGDLCRFDVDDNWANKPFNSLLGLFRAWLPMAPLDVEGRADLLAHVFRRNRAVGFRVCLELVPSRGHDAASGFVKPRWRSYRSEWPTVTNGERWRMEDTARQLLVTAAPFVSTELTELIANLEGFKPDEQITICDASEAWRESRPDAFDLAKVRDAARRVRKRALFDLHNRDQLNEHGIAHLEHVAEAAARIAEALEPDDLAARSAWLFSSGYTEWPEPEEDHLRDWRREAEKLQAARRDAATQAFAHGGMESVVRFALQMEDPSRVGEAVAGIDAEPEDYLEFVRLAVQLPDSRSSPLLRGLLRSLNGADLNGLVADCASAQGLAQDDLLRIAGALPGSPEGWRAAEMLGPRAEAAYWRVVQVYGWSLKSDDAQHAASKLLTFERPRSALVAFDRENDSISPPIWASILKGIGQGLEADGPRPDAHALQQALKRLDAAEDIDDDQIAVLEFPFAKAFTHERGRQLALHRRMRDEPQQFVEFVQMAFKRSDGVEEASMNSGLASTAWSLLNSWRAFPGLGEDGRIQPALFIAWNEEVRRLSEKAHRRKVAEVKLGEAYGHARPDPDGVWPPIPIRDLLDGANAAEMRRGFETGVHNNRGVVRKAVYEGGAQERALATRYCELADDLATTHPRLAQTMSRIAEGYAHEAKAADQQAALRERWER